MGSVQQSRRRADGPNAAETRDAGSDLQYLHHRRALHLGRADFVRRIEPGCVWLRHVLPVRWGCFFFCQINLQRVSSEEYKAKGVGNRTKTGQPSSSVRKEKSWPGRFKPHND